eukprot:m.279689 g.279689  ORF g.279689 m.279689 type:complete len:93 (+) comp15746_c1_seq2:329-607(+)
MNVHTCNKSNVTHHRFFLLMYTLTRCMQHLFRSILVQHMRLCVTLFLFTSTSRPTDLCTPIAFVPCLVVLGDATHVYVCVCEQERHVSNQHT